MSKKLYEETNIQGIAAAIREKNGTQSTYTVAQMPGAIRDIHTEPNLETLTATENGNYTPSSGKDGFSSVNVAVPSGTPNLQEKTATQNGIILPDRGYDGLSKVTVNVSGGGGDINPVIESLVGDYSFISFSQRGLYDRNNYLLGLDPSPLTDDYNRRSDPLLPSHFYQFSDIMSLFNSKWPLEYYMMGASNRIEASNMVSDILSKLNAVLLGNISGEGDLNDSIENYKRILLFGVYNSTFDASYYDVGVSYPVTTLGTPYLTGMKDRNPSYRASIIFVTNNHVTVKSNLDGLSGEDRRASIYGIP